MRKLWVNKLLNYSRSVTKFLEKYFVLTSPSASVAGAASGAEVSAGDSEEDSAGATLEAPGLSRGLGLRFNLGPGRSDAGLKPGLPRLFNVFISLALSLLN